MKFLTNEQAVKHLEVEQLKEENIQLKEDNIQLVKKVMSGNLARIFFMLGFLCS
jgi:hypothetical protein